MSDLKADVVIVGAGPAGTSAAYFLARAGVDVLLVDQATFPREKICGDGLPRHTLAMLNKMGMRDWWENHNRVDVDILELITPDGYRISNVMPHSPNELPIGITVPREKLDHALLENALNAGARFADGIRCIGMEQSLQSLQRVSGRADHTEVTLEGRIVIAADGVMSTLSRALGLRRVSPEATASRAYFTAEFPENVVSLSYARYVLPGYGWIFPMGKGVFNIGAGSFQKTKLNSREMFSRFVHKCADMLKEQISPRRGYPIPMNFEDNQVCADGVLLVGDAAGLCHPLNGEGISYALESGEMAAQHVIRALQAGDVSAAALRSYARDLYGRYHDDFQAARWVRWFMKLPFFINYAARHVKDDFELMKLVGMVLIGELSPRRLFTPSVILRTLM